MEETISEGQKGEKKLFFTETDCREPRVKRAFCAFTFLLPYFVPTFIIAGVLKNTQDSISQPIPFFHCFRPQRGNKSFSGQSMVPRCPPWGFSSFLKETVFVQQITELPFRGTKLERLNATLCQSGNVPPKTLLQQIEISGLSQLWHIRGNIHQRARYLLNQLINQTEAYFPEPSQDSKELFLPHKMKHKGTTAETCFVFVKLTFLVWFSSPHIR